MFYKQSAIFPVNNNWAWTDGLKSQNDLFPFSPLSFSETISEGNVGTRKHLLT